MRDITILLVDDNYADQHLVQLAVKESNSGTDLRIASDGDEAISYLCKKDQYTDAPRPDLIILDLNLPKKSGREVLSEIRKSPNLKEIPVVVMSSSRSSRDVAEMAALDASFFLVKPDRVDTIFATIKAIEEFCRNLVESPGAREELSDELRRHVA